MVIEEVKSPEPKPSVAEAENTVIRVESMQEESQSVPSLQPVQENKIEVLEQQNYDPREEVIQNMNIQMHHLLEQNAQLQGIVEGLKGQNANYQVMMNEMKGKTSDIR